MIRNFLSIFGGLMSGFWLIIGITKLGNVFYPQPTTIDYTKPETIFALIRSTPTGMLWFLIAGYAIGTFISAGIAARVAPSWKISHGMVIGVLFLLNSLSQMVALPYPLWFKIVGTVVFLPMAYLGGRLVTLVPSQKPPILTEVLAILSISVDQSSNTNSGELISAQARSSTARRRVPVPSRRDFP